jgi:hypothetical protein
MTRMFYEQDILEGLTKKTFYDSPRIVLTDLEQSLLEKTSTSLVLSHSSYARWHGNKVRYSTSDWTSRSRLLPQLPLVYVCLYKHMYMYICIYTHIYISICTYVYKYICIYVHMYTETYVYVRIHIHMYKVHMFMYMHMYMYVRIHMYICVHIHICMWTCIYTHISTYVYIHTYLLNTYTYIYVHTHMKRESVVYWYSVQ